MENGKSPGSDGLTSEFYKHFWKLIGSDLLDTLKQSLEDGSMTPSQRQAIITCLHKKGDRENLNNWRPISLLNVDYKILSKSVANKMANTLETIINPSQTASVPGRSILFNLSTIRDLIDYAKENDLPAVIISIDQVKAFDNVDWDFMYRILEKLGYGPEFTKTIRTMYNNITSMEKVNGHLSEEFILEKGVRQGCPLSMILYVVIGEILTNYVTLDKQVTGISIEGEEIKISQFADDTSFFVTGSKSIERISQILNIYLNASGSDINRDKCNGLWLGRFRETINEPENKLDIWWSAHSIRLLGIKFVNPGEVEFENWSKCEEKLLKNLHLWKNLRLSLKGKRLVINQLLYSQLWYLSQVMPVPQNIINLFTQHVYNFLWGDKHPLINRTITQLNIADGGLKVLNLQSMVQAMRFRWVGRLFDHKIKGPWKTLMTYQLNKYRQASQGRSVFLTHISAFKNIPTFYQEMLHAWYQLTTNPNLKKEPATMEEILNQPLFYNPHITPPSTVSDPRPPCIKQYSWAKGSLTVVADIAKVFVKGFVSYQQLQNIAETKIPIAEFNNLMSSIPRKWRSIVNTKVQQTPYEQFAPTISIEPRKMESITNLMSKDFYNLLIEKKKKTIDPKYWS